MRFSISSFGLNPTDLIDLLQFYLGENETLSRSKGVSLFCSFFQDVFRNANDEENPTLNEREDSAFLRNEDLQFT